jgi:serine/threonine protein kinase
MTKNIMCTTNTDYLIDIDEVVILKTISDKNGSKIYKALWREELVCVKEVSTTKTIHNELNVLSKCIHPKIVQFLGAHIGPTITSMLFEYMENGNLEDYVKKMNKKDVLTDHQKLMITKDIVLAIHYLHSRKPYIVIHRDVKPSNILVNKYGNVKVCDFGVSKLCQKQAFSFSCRPHSTTYQNYSGEKGTYLWMAPEVCNHEKYDHKSDIYSLGLTIYYLWTSRLPYQNENLSNVQLMYAKMNNKIRLDFSISENKMIDELIRSMTIFESTKRITTSELLQKLNAQIENFKMI